MMYLLVLLCMALLIVVGYQGVAGLSESTCVALRALEEEKVPFYILPDGQSVQVTGG